MQLTLFSASAGKTVTVKLVLKAPFPISNEARKRKGQLCPKKKEHIAVQCASALRRWNKHLQQVLMDISQQVTGASQKQVAVFLYSPLAARAKATRSETSAFPSRAEKHKPQQKQAVWQEFSLSFLPVITYTHRCTHTHTHTRRSLICQYKGICLLEYYAQMHQVAQHTYCPLAQANSHTLSNSGCQLPVVAQP